MSFEQRKQNLSNIYLEIYAIANEEDNYLLRLLFNGAETKKDYQEFLWFPTYFENLMLNS